MLTKKQIKNLKEGDKLLVEVSFISVNENHVLTCSAPVTTVTTSRGKIIKAFSSYHPSCLSMPPAKPKHDPCRKFRTGDKVRIVAWNGRIPRYLDDYIGSEHTVSFDEDINGYVRIEGEIEIAHVAHLELIAPVEENNLYFVLDSPHTFNICKRGGSKFAATFYKDRPLAREHAEKYCAALNAEHRKEQERDE